MSKRTRSGAIFGGGSSQLVKEERGRGGEEEEMGVFNDALQASKNVSLLTDVPEIWYNSIRDEHDRLDSSPINFTFDISDGLADYLKCQVGSAMRGCGRDAASRSEAKAAAMSSFCGVEVVYWDGSLPQIYVDDSIDHLSYLKSRTASFSLFSSSRRTNKWRVEAEVKRRMPLSSSHGLRKFRLAFEFQTPVGHEVVYTSPFFVMAKMGPRGTKRKQVHMPTCESLNVHRLARMARLRELGQVQALHLNQDASHVHVLHGDDEDDATVAVESDDEDEIEPYQPSKKRQRQIEGVGSVVPRTFFGISTDEASSTGERGVDGRSTRPTSPPGPVLPMIVAGTVAAGDGGEFGDDIEIELPRSMPPKPTGKTVAPFFPPPPLRKSSWMPVGGDQFFAADGWGGEGPEDDEVATAALGGCSSPLVLSGAGVGWWAGLDPEELAMTPGGGGGGGEAHVLHQLAVRPAGVGAVGWTM